jgi:ParB-like chromosome segregation protein Spo0J
MTKKQEGESDRVKHEYKKVLLSKITQDKELQPRQSLTTEAVDEYMESMTEGATLPPVLVVFDGKTYWLCDGFHRVAASKKMGAKDIECEVVKGTRQDAMWLAAAANLKHGVRRTNIDKRRAVAMALVVKPDASLREIAEHCAVTHEMVRTVKAQFDAVDEVEETARKAVKEAVKEEVIDKGDKVEKAMIASEAAVQGAMEAVASAIRKVEALLETKHAVFVNGQSVINDLKNARSALKQSTPHERCPVCGGAGCDTCRKTGWVSKKQWDLIPKNQRGGK